MIGDLTVKYLIGKSIVSKSRSDNIILVKPFPATHTKAIKHHASPDLEKSQT